MSNYVITTERLGLRRWLPADTEAFIAMNSDAAVMQYFPQPLQPQQTLAMLQRIEDCFTTNHFGLYVAEEKHTQTFLGFTGFSIPNFNNFFTPCVEVGWRYRKEAWGKGFATEAAKACIDYGFTTLHFDRIVSFTAKINLRSEAVMQRAGMTYVTDFKHPNIAKDHPLCTHVLYTISPA